MSELNRIWQRAKAQEERRRYGYVITPATIAEVRRDVALPKAKPVRRSAATVADILGFRPEVAGR